MRRVCCLLALAACQPRTAAPSPPPLERAPTPSAPPPARPSPVPKTTQRDDLRHRPHLGPESLGLPREPPGPPMCDDPDNCYVEFWTWRFRAGFHVEPLDIPSREERPNAFRVRAAVRERLLESASRIEECAHAALGRETCLRRSVGVTFRIDRLAAPAPGRTEGAPDARLIRCVADQLHALQLARLLTPGAPAVEVSVELSYFRPSYSSYIRPRGHDSWIGPHETRYVDVPCGAPAPTAD